MKKGVILSALLGLGALAFAQDQDRKNEFWIGFGGSSPVGDYASVSVTNEKAGFAMAGGNFGFYYQHNLIPNLGIVAVLQGTAHPFDEGAFSDVLEASTGVSGWKTEADAYSIGTLKAGAVFCIPYNRVKFEIRAMIGYSSVTFPEVKASLGPSSSTLSDVGATTLAYSAGAGLKIYLGQSRKLFIPIHIDYAGSSEAEFTIPVKGNASNGMVELSMPPNAINGNIGFGLAF